MTGEAIITAWCRSYKGDEHIDPLVERGHPLRFLAERIDKAIADAERAARAAAISACVDIVAEEAIRLADIRHPTERQMGALDVVSTLEDELLMFGGNTVRSPRVAPQEPDRATMARAVAVLLDEQQNLLTPKDVLEQLATHPSDVGPYQLARDRNAVIENRIAWLTETLAHHRGGGT